MLDFSKTSEAYQFSWYDVRAIFREGLLLAIPWLIVNINAVEEVLLGWGWNRVFVAFVAFMVLEGGRRFVKNYSK